MLTSIDSHLLQFCFFFLHNSGFCYIICQLVTLAVACSKYSPAGPNQKIQNVLSNNLGPSQYNKAEIAEISDLHSYNQTHFDAQTTHIHLFS